jgi:hypothetical protein
MEKQLLENKIELRKLSEDVSTGKIKADEAKRKFEELRAKKADLEKRIALAKAPVIAKNKTSSFGEIAKAMIEKRAISLNGTGAINQISELVKELSKRTPLLEGVRKFYGPNASTNIPLFTPTMAVPGAYAEGATSIAADTQASLGSRSLTPRAFVSLLPVSAESINLGSVNFESELPAIFADSFAQAFHKQICTGSGTGLNFRGIFTVAASNTNGITKDPCIAALRDLALLLQDYNDSDAVIIMHPSIYSLIMSDTTGGEVDLYKEELIRSKTIEGVKILLTSSAPNAISTSGSCYAVGGSLQNFGFAVASELQIEPLKKVGDTNTYFQASVFTNGSPILDKEYFPLLTE